MKPIVGEGCSPLGRRHEVTVGEASPLRNAPPVTIPLYHCYILCEADRFHCRDDHRSSENDGRFRYRKRKIGEKRFIHADGR